MKRSALLTLLALALMPSAALAQTPGSGKEENTDETQTVIVPIIGEPDETFIIEIFRPDGSESRARFFRGDAGGSKASRRLIDEKSLSLGDREDESAEREVRQSDGDCFVANLKGNDVEIEEIQDFEVVDRSDERLDATSGRVCVNVEEESDEGDGDGNGAGDGDTDAQAGPVAGNLYLVGRRSAGPRPRTFGRPLYRPRTVQTRSGALVVRIDWSGWSRATAVGEGTLRLGPVSGGRRYPGARIVVSGLSRGVCEGKPAFYYTRARITYPRRSGLPRSQRLRLLDIC